MIVSEILTPETQLTQINSALANIVSINYACPNYSHQKIGTIIKCKQIILYETIPLARHAISHIWDGGGKRIFLWGAAA